MNDQPLITSFIVRCSLLETDQRTNDKKWRVKVSHVQGEEEVVVNDLEEALFYMKRKIEE
ncbi:hypothetical protein [Litchfieldia alkalitelluris]|uniref:hypothetical protein n=1 Tax=Litchfieldia alkalitelluris TaxID=304268 RepID=UPI000997027E|nr:hypothetical protein [Litchfieldia alkalitelluris]